MPGRVSEALVRRAPRRRKALRALMLAVLLAGLTTFLGVGAASADYWPHGEQGAATAQHR
jgi:hypothetical protein